MKTVLAVLLALMLGAQAQAAGNRIVFYRIGESGQEAWTRLEQYFEGKGYGVSIVRGETVIEKHVEKVNRINRGPGGVFLAMELLPGELSHTMVAESDAAKGEGRFLAIDEIPARFARESDRLAASIAAPFNVKVKHLPLFPLLGVSMPGIVVKLEFKEAETEGVIAKLSRGVEQYFSERTKKMRTNGRPNDKIRDLKINRNFLKFPDGSVLVEMGETKVICGVSIEDRVPPFLRNSGKGWLTAEYSMLPRATPSRTTRESSAGRVGGRTHEIQRLIGRALRAVVNLDVIGERTIWVDCDVIQADGGTRTASITGAFVALVEALWNLKKRGAIQKIPLRDSVAAVSCGIVSGAPLLDLAYAEDSIAEVDMNFVMTGKGMLIEVQGTAEKAPFSKELLDMMYEYSAKAIAEITRAQKAALGPLFPLF